MLNFINYYISKLLRQIIISIYKPFYKTIVIVASIFFIYIISFLIYKFIKKYKYTFSNIKTHNKVFLFICSIIGIIVTVFQLYLTYYYFGHKIPVYIIFLSLSTLISYIFIYIFSVLKTTKLDIARQKLKREIDYTSNLKLLYDDICTFRHDFGNIIQAINGYIETDDIKGLQEYYKQLNVDCEDIKTLEALNPELINNPAVYSLLTSKYKKASEYGIIMNIHISLNLKSLNMKIYDFSRILGILLDNAIEAASNCDNKIINLEIKKDPRFPRQILLVQNTYNNTNIDLNKIAEKGYTSKVDNSKPHGLGLWQVQKILKHSKNLNLFTTTDSHFFTQQLEIYDK